MSDPLLADALRAFLVDWRDDLPKPWRKALDGVEPAFENVKWKGGPLKLHAGERIYPGRKGAPIPGAPQGAHVFRALDRLKPADVRAVVIGQDPYTHLRQATGRAFEQGDLAAWAGTKTKTAPSLRRIAQAAARLRGLTAIAELPAPRALFDAWEAEGVLFLNAGLTISRYVPGGGPEQKYGHLPLWRPILRRLLEVAAAGSGGRAVFLAWGAFAQGVADDAGLPPTRVVRHVHPAVPGFLKAANPFRNANDALADLGAPPIAW